jgi:hypothetical protein
MAEETRRDIDLVLVTGAGASREFGNPSTRGSSTLPLMGDWSDSLFKKLADVPAGTELVGLNPGLDGPEFERRLGRFLRLAQLFPDLKPWLIPSARAAGFLQLEAQLPQWHDQTEACLRLCVKSINESLYENFGWERTMPSAAVEAYGRIFEAMRVDSQTSLVYATTNYDRIGEAVLDDLGWLVDAGEHRAYSGPGVASAETIAVDGLLNGLPRYTPVLHLHGALGWYRREIDGAAIVANASRFDEGFGTPIIMLPDPEKDYEAEPVIQSLWEQFRESLRRAKAVLVLGHSLNDAALIGALTADVAPQERIAITLLGSKDNPEKADESTVPTMAIIRDRFPSASVIPLRFDKSLEPPELAVRTWYQRLDEATND